MDFETLKEIYALLQVSIVIRNSGAIYVNDVFANRLRTIVSYILIDSFYNANIPALSDTPNRLSVCTFTEVSPQSSLIHTSLTTIRSITWTQVKKA